MQPLTDRQREVYDVITRSIADRGYPPTLREIADAIGVSGRHGIEDHLRALARKGYIVRVPLISRGIRIVERAAS